MNTGTAARLDTTTRPTTANVNPNTTTTNQTNQTTEVTLQCRVLPQHPNCYERKG